MLDCLLCEKLDVICIETDANDRLWIHENYRTKRGDYVGMRVQKRRQGNMMRMVVRE